MARSAPSLSHALHFSAEPAVAMTRDPSALASIMAVVPMPLDPPWTSRVSPALSAARSKTFVHTVKKVSGMAAASTIESPLGTGKALSSAAMQYSA
jgi:hypothetical protein